MSVGHVSRQIEEQGIPTVCVFVRSFGHVAEQMGVPRTVVTRHPMGRPLGAPGDTQRHEAVLAAALDLLETATARGTIVELVQRYRPTPN